MTVKHRAKIGVYRFFPIWFVVAPTAAAANDLSNLYNTTKLAQEKPRFERRINEMFTKAIWTNLTRDEKRALSGVTFELPLVGMNHDPMDYYSGKRGGQRFVAMPILSLMFLEDLSTAYAWLYLRKYSLETIDEYVTMLRYKKAADFSGSRYPLPLKALQIPSNALADRRVDKGCIAVVAHRADPSTLAPRCPREKTATLLERWCGKKQ